MTRHVTKHLKIVVGKKESMACLKARWLYYGNYTACSFGATGVWTQGLMFTRQALDHSSHSASYYLLFWSSLSRLEWSREARAIFLLTLFLSTHLPTNTPRMYDWEILYYNRILWSCSHILKFWNWTVFLETGIFNLPVDHSEPKTATDFSPEQK
jgi:hypothetical protein